MKRENAVKEKLRTAVEHTAPDVLDNILAGCAPIERKGDVIVMEQQTYKKNTWMKPLIAMAAALVIVLGGVGGVFYTRANAVAAVVGVDVNPSVELKVNRQEKVLEALAVNADGEAILSDMDLRGAQLNVALRAVLGAMLEKGFVTEIANSVLITVENAKGFNQQDLEQRLAAQAEQVLAAANLQAAVVAQALESKDTALSQLAKANNISDGKAQLVQAVADVSPNETFESLAKLSINELNLLMQAKQVPVTQQVVRSGNASDKSYIGAEKAQQIAFDAVGVKAADVMMKKTELDFDDGYMMYEVEFYANNTEYEIDVEATQGAVLKMDVEGAKGFRGGAQMTPPAPNTNNNTSNTPASAASAASPVQNVASQPTKPSATIPGNSSSSSSTAATTPSGGAVYYPDWDDMMDWDYVDQATGQKALNAAIKHAGVNSANVYDTEVEQKRFQNNTVYEVEFSADGTEYLYLLNPQNLSVVASYNKPDDDYYKYQNKNNTDAMTSATTRVPAQKNQTPAQKNQASVPTQGGAAGTYHPDWDDQFDWDYVDQATGQKALNAATAHAGVTNAYDVDVELKRYQGGSAYEVEFQSGPMEYKYYIDVNTFGVLSFYSEYDD